MRLHKGLMVAVWVIGWLVMGEEQIAIKFALLGMDLALLGYRWVTGLIGGKA